MNKAYFALKSKESYERKRADGRYMLSLAAKMERYKTDEAYKARIKQYNRARYHTKKTQVQVVAT
jgi:hypothetical protein